LLIDDLEAEGLIERHVARGAGFQEGGGTSGGSHAAPPSQPPIFHKTPDSTYGVRITRNSSCNMAGAASGIGQRIMASSLKASAHVTTRLGKSAATASSGTTSASSIDAL
jgi:hypothetical protein